MTNTPRAYYNEIEPFAAQWLRNLIAKNLIAQGDVDERSITDVRPADLDGYTQCHFFAGLGGWSRALRVAGWPDDRPVWTGSCPCQPFSVAGNQAGFDDPRHLWPQFRRLISEQRPATVFGEQVAGASDWLRLVRSDLEAMAYAVGAIPMEAASAGADHFRDRYWFVANDDQQCAGEGWQQRGWELGGSGCDTENHVGALGDANDAQRRPDRHARNNNGWGSPEWDEGYGDAKVASVSGLPYLQCPDGKWRRLPPSRVRWLGNGIPARVAKLRAFGNAIDPRPAARFITAVMESINQPDIAESVTQAGWDV
jgi:DNA (cytosine-5)-methyltransferase 1